MARKSSRKSTNGQNLVAKNNPRSPISEQYRTIRTNIQFSTVDTKVRSILVTSSSPSEGKSTTVGNLAVVFAQQGKKVLLVDTDLRRPTMQFAFDITNNTGLTNVLMKQTSLMEAVYRADEENLYVLPSGPIPPNPAELLASKAMDELVEQMYGEFDIVLFDSPPILAVTDAQILANRCDGTILVVRSAKSDKDEMRKAKELLDSVNANVLGAVLNRKKLKKQQYYYYQNK
ncbi:CpsD/CapB family tyrosine-protein kinase [Peribacillus sp. NPDC097225]|uniref:CpsD/CapB family tyrosine-protein kinase n=1 Tax=Peribacillus sp. NPDC097225 TaxID=3364400 RepID=UPI003813DF1B